MVSWDNIKALLVGKQPHHNFITRPLPQSVELVVSCWRQRLQYADEHYKQRCRAFFITITSFYVKRDVYYSCFDWRRGSGGVVDLEKPER
jgi:hypothetical protein